MSYNELKQHGTPDFPFELYHIDRHHPKYEMAYHWHAENELIRILSGRLHLTLNNRKMTAEAGDIVYVNGETLHGGEPEDCVYECLVFSPGFLPMTENAFMEGLLSNTLYVREKFPAEDPGCEPVRLLCDRIFRAMQEMTPGYRCTVAGGFYMLYGFLADQGFYSENHALQFCSEKDEKNVQKLKHVLSFIRDSFDQPITLNDMADVAGMSPQYFCAFFKMMTNKSPFGYVNSYRIERASRKLLNTERSVTEIAYACGFNDLSYFIKTFKAEKGVTPNAFRRGSDL